jgi:ectoine hydroxylase-related dioxygenase (phytanoyl-CoA dioxygenase family)
MGELPVGEDPVVDRRRLEDEDVRRVGFDAAGSRVLELEPGDVALWHHYTVHGSGPNSRPSIVASTSTATLRRR